MRKPTLRYTEDSSKSLRKITISLSPINYYESRPHSIQKVLDAQPVKSASKNLKTNKNSSFYSIAYIGDDSGKLSISVQKAKIPLLSPNQKPKRWVSSQSTPKYFSQNNHKIHQYLKPKPLTPASIRLYDFSEYKHKATSLGNKYRARKIKLSLNS